MESGAGTDHLIVDPRIAIRALAALLCAGAFAGVAGGCGGSTAATLDPIAQAADATTRAGGAQVAMTVSMSAPALGSSPITITGAGDFNLAHGEGQLSFTLGGLPASAGAGSASFDELFAAGELYMRSSLFEGKLPGGAQWIKLDVAELASSIGVEPSSLTGGQQDPTEYLQELRASGGSVRVAGHEDVRGVPTTRYEGTIDLRRVGEQAPASNRAKLEKAIEALIHKSGVSSYPVSVWIDAHHLLRRMKLETPVPTTGGSATVEVELFGFGATPTVTPPPASETFDATKLSLQDLSSVG